ncbi:MAG: DnaJ domain-containing protein, partial [Candidatus Peribacteraceae bacterium]|nr:DnaJ domain-containing protein [Candidatus Peribacteraceae bacterium]
MSKDYYQTLGIDRSSSTADIKKSYRDLSKKWHPDKHKGDKDAEQKFKEINEAYEVLGNEKRKAQYDQFGTVGGGPGGGGFGGFDFSGFQQSDMGDLGDIFSSFFGGGGGGRSQRPRDQRGGDLQVRLAVEFSEIVTGTKKTITIEKLMMCTPCT